MDGGAVLSGGYPGMPDMKSDGTFNTSADINVELGWSNVTQTPQSIKARATVGPITGQQQTFSTTGFSAGEPAVFGLNLDVSTLATGAYPVTVEVVAQFASGSISKTIHDEMVVINSLRSPFGKRFTLPSLDRLAPAISGSGAGSGSGGSSAYGGSPGGQLQGMAHIRGDNTASWYLQNGSGYTSPDGSQSTLTSVSGGFELKHKHGDVDVFNSAGLLMQKRDRNGNVTKYEYVDGNNDGIVEEVSKVIDPTGRATTYVYYAGYLQSVTDHAGRKTTYLNSGGNVISTTYPDPDGAGPLTAPVEYFSYGADGRLASKKDAENRETTFEYHPDGRLKKSIKPDGSVWQFTHMQFAGLNVSANQQGSGGVVSLIRPGSVIATVKDGRGITTTLKTDDLGNLLEKRVDGDAEHVVYERDDDGRVTKQTHINPDGAGPLGDLVTTYQYDAQGNRTRVTWPDGTFQTWAYEAQFNFPIRFVDELGRTTRFEYDAKGNLTKEIHDVTVLGAGPGDPGTPGKLWQNQANRFDVNKDSVISELDKTAISTHSKFGTTLPPTLTAGNTPAPASYLDVTGDGIANQQDIDAITDRLTGSSPTTRFEYGPVGGLNGLLTRVTDPRSYRTEYTYGGIITALDYGRLTKVVTAVGSTVEGQTTYKYDQPGHVIETREKIDGTLANDLITKFIYDNLDRLTQRTDPFVSSTTPLTTSYLYDKVGNLIEVRDPQYAGDNRRNTRYEYDGLNHVKKITYPVPTGTDDAQRPTVLFTYDANGNLASQTDVLGRVTTFGYDQANRQNYVRLPGATLNEATTLTFDTQGHVLSSKDALQNETKYRYDNRGRLVEVTQPNPGTAAPVTKYEHDVAGQLIAIIDPLNRRTDYTYDSVGRQIGVLQPKPNATATSGNASIRPRTVSAYDPAGNLTGVFDPLGNPTEFAYNERNWLVKTTQADPDGPSMPLLRPVTQYGYNRIGQQTDVTDPLGRATRNVYNHGWLQQTVYGLGSVDQSTITLGYDLVGNLSVYNNNGVLTKYTYDRLNRVLTVAERNKTAATTYGYNAAGQVLSVADELGRTTTYEYDTHGRVSKVIEPDPDGSLSTYQPAFTTYTYDAVGHLLTETDALDQTTTQHYDALYRRDWTQDPLGNKTTFQYDAVGNLLGTVRLSPHARRKAA